MPDSAPAAFREWTALMLDLANAALRFTKEHPLSVSPEQRESVALKAALYARALTLFEGTLALWQQDRQLDFRIHARGIVEATMYLIALDRDAGFIERMKDDDDKSRHARATLHLRAERFEDNSDVKALLEEFVAESLHGKKPLKLGTLLEGSDFERLYRTYRDISGDAAHVSITSLNRHYVEDPADGSALLMIHPELDSDEILLTMNEIGIAMFIATLILMKTKTKTDLWDEFQILLSRYRDLQREKIARYSTGSAAAIG
jgi:hypothetical protein